MDHPAQDEVRKFGEKINQGRSVVNVGPMRTL